MANLLQMSISGALMIAVVVLLRALLSGRVPKKVFLALWGIVLLRLLAPLSIPAPWSVYTPADRKPQTEITMPAAESKEDGVLVEEPAPQSGAVIRADKASVLTVIWSVGAAGCACWFAVSYVRCRRRFAEALPVEHRCAAEWCNAQGLRRRIVIRQSDRISTPLTYGLMRPVILVPKTVDWDDAAQMRYILTHELVHIRRLDTLTKLLMAAALCIHWFNPLVWVLFVLGNRDLELSCDEAVVRELGLQCKADYARTLVRMEAERSGLAPLYSGFGKQAMEARIRAILNQKHLPRFAGVLGGVLITVVALMLVISAVTPQEAEATVAEDRPAAAAAEKFDLEAALLEYAEHGLTMENGIAYFQGARVRYFLDGYESPDGRGGSSTISRYTYYDAAGTVDVHTVREDRRLADGSTELFGPITDIEADPQEVFDAREFMDADLIQEATATGSGNVAGETAAERFAAWEPYGVRFEKTEGGRGNVYWDGELIGTFLDCKPDGSVFTFQSDDSSPVQAATVYDEKGTLIGICYLSEDTDDSDAALYAKIEEENAAQWDDVLAAYVPFGLTYEYDAAKGVNGYGLTMRYGDREVRGIYDERAGTWITEHTGNGVYAGDAIELYAVYEDGVLSDLRPASAEEQAQWDALRAR